MEEQTLQPVPELIDGKLCEETEIYREEAEVKKEDVKMEDEDDYDEEFYEKIEAPKFVDFTKPYTVRTDDRYWFCSRVGCDRKHEEEINPEEISKNFVLRVMAARSPNIKLQKALYRQQSSIKCPLSAPAKPSKPRIPKSAMGSSLISDPKNKIGPCSKTGSTPVVRSRQVASKYMTTPRNKVCNPNANSFRSVQNPKTTTVDVVKTRTVAKALVFHSPKKAIVLKKSIELHTPLKKICEGMKRLKIASQKKTLKGSTSKVKKPDTEDSSRRQLKIRKSEKKSNDSTPNKKTTTYKGQSLDEQVADVKPSDGPASESSTKEDMHQHKTSNKKTATYKCRSLDERMADVKSSDGPASESSMKEDMHQHKTPGTPNPHALKAEMNDLSNIEDKDLSNEVENDKENALNPQDSNRSNNQPLGDKILNKEIHKKNKAVQTAGPSIAKCKKPKPTSIKPFRLRTDERGILKEAILEKKLRIPVPEKPVEKDTARSRHEPTQQRSMTSLRTRSQRVVSPKKEVRVPGQQLGVIEDKCSRLPGDVMVAGAGNKKSSRAVCGARSISRTRGKQQHVTIAKEPNFHTLHLPRTCSRKIA